LAESIENERETKQERIFIDTNFVAMFTLSFSLNRILYGNRITELPAGMFHGLTSLQLLLLNANRISCVRRDSFKDLHNLNLL
jgi:hypothetical protein